MTRILIVGLPTIRSNMTYYLIKLFLSAFVIVVISEISKRTTLLGGLLASLPLVSILGLSWLYIDTKNTEKVAQLTTSIFWMVLPSLSLFVVLPILLKTKLSFLASLSISLVIMSICYLLMILILNKVGIRL